MFTETILLIAILALVLFVWQKRTNNFWDRVGVKNVQPQWIVGNAREFLTGKLPFYEQIYKLHTTPGFEKEPFIGINMLHRPGLIIRDLELIKTVMIKKFNCFTNRVVQADPHVDVLGANTLFFARNPSWRELRTKITPVFTSGKIKQMYPLLVEVGEELESYLDCLPKKAELRVKDLAGRFTTDLIATSAMGVKANSLKDVNSEFYLNNSNFFKFTWGRVFDSFFLFLIPSLSRIVRARVFPKETTDFFHRIVCHVMEERKKSGHHRNDLIDILLAMQKEALADPDQKNNAKDVNFLVAQAAGFQTGGYETSASTMTFTLFELANNLEIQNRLHQEIQEYYGEGKSISYEHLHEMPYLTKVINETLRKYPIAGVAERECTQPNEGERFNLKPYNDFELPNGMPIYVSSLGIHRDPQYWPEPEKYDPERFDPSNRHNINMDAYMPFGIGPHNCIGMRLGLLQAKLGIIHMLRNHRVTPSASTIKRIEFSPLSVVLSSKDEVLLNIERI
ncbi:probable cytochrome P450 6w1 [Drosophila tropicalis]|uniref:probable cytochrome P450 6w1 n=1 Tax=Drosophila tropicalis TaxID=46794 RepID=UPI0035ABD7A2